MVWWTEPCRTRTILWKRGLFWLLLFAPSWTWSQNTIVSRRKQRLVYHLNSSGKYFAFKEQLKHAVVKIVREKYLRTTNFQDKDELQVSFYKSLNLNRIVSFFTISCFLQHFLSELYVFLIDQMHVGLREVLQIEDQGVIPDPPTDTAQLKHFAREAEVNGNFELASKYYQEVLHLAFPFIIYVNAVTSYFAVSLLKAHCAREGRARQLVWLRSFQPLHQRHYKSRRVFPRVCQHRSAPFGGVRLIWSSATVSLLRMYLYAVVSSCTEWCVRCRTDTTKQRRSLKPPQLSNPEVFSLGLCCVCQQNKNSPELLSVKRVNSCTDVL